MVSSKSSPDLQKSNFPVFWKLAASLPDMGGESGSMVQNKLCKELSKGNGQGSCGKIPTLVCQLVYADPNVNVESSS